MKCAAVAGIGGDINLQIFHKRNLPIAREALWTALGQGLSILGSLGLIRILTSYLTSAEYGYLALGLTASTLYSQVVMGGVSASVGRYYSIYLARDDLVSYLRGAVALVKYASLFVFIFAVIVVIILSITGHEKWIFLIVGICIFSLLTGINSSIISILTAARLRLSLAINAAIEIVLKVCFVLFCLLACGPKAESVIGGYCASSFVLLIFLRYLLNKKIILKKFNKKIFQEPRWSAEMWSFMWPFLIMGIAAWGQLASSRWILEFYATLSDVGVFQVLVQIAAPIQILSSVLIVFIAPIYFSLSGDDALQSNKQLIRATTFRIATSGLCLVAVLFVMVELFHQEIYSLLVSRNFLMDSHYLPLMIASSGILGISQIFCTQLYSELRIKEVMYAGIFSGFIGIVLNVQLGIAHGLTGIIWAQFIFAIVNFLWLLFLTISKRSSNV